MSSGTDPYDSPQNSPGSYGNPYGDRPNDVSLYGGGSYGSQYSGGPPPRRGMSTGMILALVFGLVIGLPVLGFAMCCGGLFLLGSYGIQEDEKVYSDKLRGNATIRQQIGDIEELSYNILASSAIEDIDVEVYDVKGTRGSGKITMSVDGDQNIHWARLELSTGQKFDVIGRPEF